MSDWYEDNIELGVREIVRLLRNNGVNTESSCEHEKYVQCQYTTDSFLMDVDNMLFNAGFFNYEIDVRIIRENGYLRTMMNIKFVNLKEFEATQ